VELSQPARELMDNQAFKTAIEEVTHKYYEAWQTTHEKDVEMREKFYMAHRIIKQVKMHIVMYRDEGKLNQKHVVRDIKRS